MTKTIMPFSGGLDSTYVLYKLLLDTTDEVTVLYISFKNVNNVKHIQMDVEPTTQTDNKKQRVLDIITWLKTNVRDFTVIEHEYDATLLADIEWKNAQTYMTKFALPKINNGEYDKIVSAMEKENDGFNNPMFESIPGSTRSLHLFQAQATRGTTSFPLIDNNYHQGYAITELPSDLYALTRSCDNAPFDQPPCGYCFKCSKHKFFQNLIDKGFRMGDIWDYVISKSITKKNKWVSMKYWLSEEVPTYTLFNSKHDVPIAYHERDIPQWPQSYTVPE